MGPDELFVKLRIHDILKHARGRFSILLVQKSVGFQKLCSR